MNSKKSAVVGAAVALLLVSATAWAHHAGSLYDRDHNVTVTGTVTQYEFANPHTRIHFEVKDEQGNVVKWVAESAPPQRLYRAGWRTDSLKPGDQITVSGFPMKDGSKFITVRRLVGPTGKVLTEGAE